MAALAVFTAKGYQAATTREIALHAGLGAATLFRYAEQKRDLLLMIVNDGLDAATAEARLALAVPQPFADRLAAVFAPRFRYWGNNLGLARDAMHETVLARSAGDTSREVRRYLEGRAALVGMLADLVRDAQANGTLDPRIDPEMVTTLFLTIYLSQLRLWVAERRPVVERGVADLRALYALAIAGVGSRA